MSQLVFFFYKYRNPEKVNFNSNAGNRYVDKARARAKKERNSFCLPLSFQEKVWPRLKVCLPASKSGLKVCVSQPLLALRSRSQVCPPPLDCSSFWI